MKISIIIPTFNEEMTIHETLKNLLAFHKPDEVIVVDGGSTDQTVSIASEWTTVIQTSKGRAHQMNIGVGQAKGDILLFLHADTILPLGGLETIRGKISEGWHAGRFRMKFDDRRWLLRFYESYTRFHFFSYGDQAFFVTRKVFQGLDGFNEIVPFEDIDFYKRLRRMTKPVIIKDPVTTSARRFCGIGCLRQKFINLFLVGLYYMGWNVLKHREKLYPDVR